MSFSSSVDANVLCVFFRGDAVIEEYSPIGNALGLIWTVLILM